MNADCPFVRAAYSAPPLFILLHLQVVHCTKITRSDTYKDTAQACLYLVSQPDLLPCVAQSLEINKRIQRQNNAPVDFPAFVRDGFDIKIMADDYERDNKGLIYKV